MKEKDNNEHRSPGSNVTVHSTDMRETARALELAMVQIETSLRESDQAVEALIGAITSMAGCAHRIEQQLDGSYQNGENAATRDSIMAECQQTSHDMKRAVSAFQFYDLLSQRIMHIRDNLRAVVEVMHAPDQQHLLMWRQLHEKLQSVYTLEQEQTMYQALLDGLSAEKVMLRADTNERNSCGDIELF